MGGLRGKAACHYAQQAINNRSMAPELLGRTCEERLQPLRFSFKAQDRNSKGSAST